MSRRELSHDAESVEARLRRCSIADSGAADAPPPSESHAHESRSDESQATHPRIVYLAQVTPYLRPVAGVLYAHTLPELNDRTVALLRGERHAGEGPYRGYRTVGHPSDGTGTVKRLRCFRAVQLISSIYSRCIEPVRFNSSGGSPVSKTDVVNAFARGLLGDRTRAAVDLVAGGLRDVRSLDQYQPGIGTASARWMQYLAREALDAEVLQIGDFTPADKRSLRAALSTIQESVTAVDRYSALSHGVRPHE